MIAVDLDRAVVHHARRIFVTADDVEQVAKAGGMSALGVDDHFAQLLFTLEFAAGLQNQGLLGGFQSAAGKVDVTALQPGRDGLR